jgi:hypothetical protein
MHALTRTRTWLNGLSSRRLLLTLCVALAWLALAAGPARADLIVYNFSGDSVPPGSTMSGSFEIDSNAIQNNNGIMTPGDLQSLDFKVTDPTTGVTDYTIINTPFTFDVDPKTFDPTLYTLNFSSTTSKGFTLNITGTGPDFSWVAQNAEGPFAGGNGTITHTTVSAVPTPPALALFGLGGLCLAGYAWRRRRLVAA